MVTHRRLAAGGPPAGGEKLAHRLGALLSEPGEEVAIPVDDLPEAFEVWRDADGWWAGGQHSGNGLVLEGRGMEPASLALRRIPDVEPYLEGRRAQIRAARGES